MAQAHSLGARKDPLENRPRAAAENLKKVSLELGGKSPAVIFQDVADVDAAIAGAANAIFFNHGQCCCAGSRLLVEKALFDRVVEGVAKKAAAIKLGAGVDPATEMGPLVSEEQLARVSGYIASGREQGATILSGGTRIADRGYFVAPTVFTNTHPEMKKQSGWGREMGGEALELYTETKSVCVAL